MGSKIYTPRRIRAAIRGIRGVDVITATTYPKEDVISLHGEFTEKQLVAAIVLLRSKTKVDI